MKNRIPVTGLRTGASRHSPVFVNLETKRLAIDILTRGQFNPIVIDPDRPKTVVAGSFRVAAIRLINRGFTYRGKRYKPRKRFVWVKWLKNATDIVQTINLGWRIYANQ